MDDEFAYYTQRAGEVCRQFDLAGVGAVWILQGAQSPAQKLKLNNHLPHDLLLCLGFIVLSLAVDAVQYFIGAGLWYAVWVKGQEEGKKNVHQYPQRVTSLFLFGQFKLAFGFVGFSFLIKYALEYLL